MNRSCARWFGGLALLTAPVVTGCQRCCPRECVEVPAVAAPLPRSVPTVSGAAEQQIFLKIEVYRVPSGHLTDRHESLRMVDGHPGGVLTKAEADAFRVELSKQPGLKVVAMPAIVVVAGQDATLFAGETIHADSARPGGTNELTFSVDGDNWTGVRVQVVPSPSADGMKVSLDFALASRPPVASGQAADLAASKASAIAFHVAALTIPMGKTAMLWTGPTSDSAKPHLVVLVTPKILRPEPVAQAVPTAPPPPAQPPTEVHSQRSKDMVVTTVVVLNAIKLTVSFENESLHQVLKEVATKANLQMVVSPRVKDVPVTLDARDQDVASLLNALGKDRFRWAIEDYGIVRITELAQ